VRALYPEKPRNSRKRLRRDPSPPIFPGKNLKMQGLGRLQINICHGCPSPPHSPKERADVGHPRLPPAFVRFAENAGSVFRIANWRGSDPHRGRNSIWCGIRELEGTGKKYRLTKKEETILGPVLAPLRPHCGYYVAPRRPHFGYFGAPLCTVSRRLILISCTSIGAYCIVLITFQGNYYYAIK
jgi:hypothetical protein